MPIATASGSSPRMACRSGRVKRRTRCSRSLPTLGSSAAGRTSGAWTPWRPGSSRAHAPSGSRCHREGSSRCAGAPRWSRRRWAARSPAPHPTRGRRGSQERARRPRAWPSPLAPSRCTGRASSIARPHCGPPPCADIRARADHAGEAQTLTWLGLTARKKGDLGDARAHLENALRIGVEHNVRAELVETHNGLGLVAQDEDRLEDSRRHFDETLKLAQAVGDRRAIAKASGNLGLTYAYLGELARARQLITMLRDSGRALGDTRYEANGMANLAMLDILGGPAPLGACAARLGAPALSGGRLRPGRAERARTARHRARGNRRIWTSLRGARLVARARAREGHEGG